MGDKRSPRIKLNARELRRRKPTPEELAKIKRRPIYLILDNVLDTYNIGGLFRLADAIAAEKLVLCGESETPPSSRIHKAAVGLEEWVPWQYEKDARTAISKLKTKDSPAKGGRVQLRVIAVEQSGKSIPYYDLRFTDYDLRKTAVAVVVGHETEGVSKNVLEIADLVVEIPMFGVNKSLNVIVSAAIVAYKILEVASPEKHGQ